MRKVLVVLVAAGCLALLAGTLSITSQGVVQAQVKCDPKVEKCDTGTPCSPGYWKNHLDQFYTYCDAAVSISSFTSCQELLDALNCHGSDASCGRSAAGAALDEVSGCVE